MRNDQIQIPHPPPERPSDNRVGSALAPADKSARLSWTGLRRRITLGILVISLIVVALIVLLVPTSKIIRPGDLTRAHAQILEGSDGQQRCSACHSDSSLSITAFLSGSSSHPDTIRQGQLCLDCHRKTIPENLAFSAHNLPQSVREELGKKIRLASSASPASKINAPNGFLPSTTHPTTSIDQNSVSCRTCHREHHGADATLLTLSDAQCQTCHTQQLHSFAKSHPEFGEWPYGRGGQISFDHVSHFGKHFSSERLSTSDGRSAASMDCSICHPSSHPASVRNRRQHLTGVGNGEPLRTAAYELACSSCHDDALRVTLNDSLELVSLPILPAEVADGRFPWPSESIGFIDGVISPITELLMRNDRSATSALRQYVDGDVSRAIRDQPESNAELRSIAQGIQALMNDLASGDPRRIEGRLTESGVSPIPFRSVLRTLPPQWIDDTRNRWFGKTSKNSPIQSGKTERQTIRLTQADSDDLLFGPADPENDDLLLLQTDTEPLLDVLQSSKTGKAHGPTTDSNPIAFHSESERQTSGWNVDDSRFAVEYKPVGHNDPVVRGLIETFAQLSEADPLKQRFFDTPVANSCLQCHQSARSVPATWKSTSTMSPSNGFTKFSHVSHLKIGRMRDCRSCHRLAETPKNFGQTSAMPGRNFLPMQKETCSQCHSAKAAGDNCTTCHRYHIQSSQP